MFLMFEMLLKNQLNPKNHLNLMSLKYHLFPMNLMFLMNHLNHLNLMFH